MIPTAFDYKRAKTLDEAIALLGEPDAKLLAGGHSLIPLMKFRLSEPATLIDIGRVPGLSGIGEANGRIEIGSTTVHADIESSDLLRQRAPVVAETAHEIGDPQVRNRGTIGGSLAHADPAADNPAVMVALDAEIRLKGKSGWRAVQAENFFQDLFTVDMQPDEIIASVQFDPISSAAYVKLPQRASHYAIVGVCAALIVRNNVCESARIAVTGAASHAQRLVPAEERLIGKPLTQATIDEAAATADSALRDVNSDIHASEAYRRAMVKVFTRRAIERAVAR